MTRPACMWKITEPLGRLGEDDPSRRPLVVEVEPGARLDPPVPQLLGEQSTVESLPAPDDAAMLAALAEKIRTRPAEVSQRVCLGLAFGREGGLIW